MCAVVNAADGPGNVSDTLIKKVYCGYVEGNNMCSIVFDKPIQNKASCANNASSTVSYRMQFQLNDEIGKALLSLALTAYTTGKSVNISSTGFCNIFSGLSDLDLIELN